MAYLIFLLIIVFIMVLGQVNYKQKVKKNEEEFSVVSNHAYEVLSDCNADNLKFEKYMNDCGEYFIVAKSKKDDVLAVVTKTECHRMRFALKSKCEVNINWLDENQSKFMGIKCTVSQKDVEPFEVILCEKKYRAKGFIGKMMLQNAEFFKKDIEGKEA